MSEEFHNEFPEVDPKLCEKIHSVVGCKLTRKILEKIQFMEKRSSMPKDMAKMTVVGLREAICLLIEVEAEEKEKQDSESKGFLELAKLSEEDFE